MINKPRRPPTEERKTAKEPSPLRSSSWPGRTLRAVSSSGLPRNTEGMKSTKVWVIDKETTKITKRKIWAGGNKGTNDKRITEIRLTWTPGIRPVKQPERIPRKSANKRPIKKIKKHPLQESY